jgi:hypothetical protein
MRSFFPRLTNSFSPAHDMQSDPLQTKKNRSRALRRPAHFQLDFFFWVRSFEVLRLKYCELQSESHSARRFVNYFVKLFSKNPVAPTK